MCIISEIELSLGWVVFVSADPNIPVLGRQPGTQVFKSIDDFPDSETYPGLLGMVNFPKAYCY